MRVVVFKSSAFFESENAMRLYDSLKSVGDSDDGAMIELLVNLLLDECLRVDIDVSGGFVQHEYFIVP